MSPKQFAHYWTETHGSLDEQERLNLLADPRVESVESMRPMLVRQAIRASRDWRALRNWRESSPRATNRRHAPGRRMRHRCSRGVVLDATASDPRMHSPPPGQRHVCSARTCSAVGGKQPERARSWEVGFPLSERVGDSERGRTSPGATHRATPSFSDSRAHLNPGAVRVVSGWERGRPSERLPSENSPESRPKVHLVGSRLPLGGVQRSGRTA